MTNAALVVLKAVCSLISICLFLSSIPRMRQVVRSKRTGETPLLPLVCMFFNYICWCSAFGTVGSCTDYFPLAATSVLGFTPGIVYTCIWIKFTPDRSYAFKTVGITVVLLGVVSLYVVLAWQGVLFNQTSAQIGDVTGYIAVAFYLCLRFPSEQQRRSSANGDINNLLTFVEIWPKDGRIDSTLSSPHTSSQALPGSRTSIARNDIYKVILQAQYDAETCAMFKTRTPDEET